jgi:hypothetical protein
MARATVKNAAAEMSDAAVLAKTGKTWDQWYALLDKDGAASLPHKEIAILLSAKHGVGDWWSQMVTVAYERARGLRAKHQTARGYVAGRSKTLAVPLDELFAAWNNPRRRKRWLPDEDFVIRKATPNKSMRITWPDDTDVEVMFYAKGDGKSQVTIQHSKLASTAHVNRSKTFWGKRLDALTALLTRKSEAPARKSPKRQQG